MKTNAFAQLVNESKGKHMKASTSIDHAVLTARFNFMVWLEKKYVDELRQMTFVSPVRHEVEALIREYDARSPDSAAQVQIPL